MHDAAVTLHEAATPTPPKVADAIKKAAKTLKKAASRQSPKPKKEPKPKKLSQWKQTVQEQANAWGMPPEEYEKIVTELHREHAEHAGMQEAAKLHARKVTGLTAADINRLENQGYDHGSDVEETKGLDDIGRSLAAMYPSLGWGRGYDSEGGDDTDYGGLLWNILREGKQSVPSKRSPEFLAHVDDFLNAQMNSHGPVGTYDSHGGEEMVPFAKSGGLRIRYAKLRQIRTRYAGFRNDQERDEFGRWAKIGADKDSGGGESYESIEAFFQEMLDNHYDVDSRLGTYYAKVSSDLFSRMSKTAKELMAAGTKEVCFYDSKQHFDLVIKPNDEYAFACYDPPEGILHLDGAGLKTIGIEGIYAHEFFHAIDGQNSSLSANPEWKAAWQQELSKGQLTLAATKSESEGFAELGRAVLTSRLTPKEMEALWPKSIAFLKKHHLIKQT